MPAGSSESDDKASRNTVSYAPFWGNPRLRASQEPPAFRVYRTRNAGGSWEALSRGLPQKGAYETVLRDALSSDSLDPAGIYFGTRSGKLYGSRDEGKSWKKIVEGLPQILCVKAAVVHMDEAPTTKPNLKSKTAKKEKPTRAKSVMRRRSY